MIHNHRQIYRLIRDTLREGTDTKILANAEKLRQEGFGWRYDGLGDWTTEAIFDQLNAFGIQTSREQFEQQARTAGRTLELEERWRKGIEIDDRTPWDDFPFLACEELWRRLTPHLLCPEIVAARLEEAIERQDEDVDWNAPDVGQENIDAAMMLMDYLDEFPAQERQGAFEQVVECSAYDFGEWLVDIAMDYGDKHVDRAKRIVDVMSQTDYAEILSTDLASSLVRADRDDEAIDLVEKNLGRWPKSTWVRIKSGDVHEDLGNNETAADLYAAALKAATNPYDWEGAAERLRPLLRKMGRQRDWDELKRENPRPAEPPILPFSDESYRPSQATSPPDLSGPIGILTSGPSPRIVTAPAAHTAPVGKTGRNDPCPCGSGKKYKKCCLKRE